MKLLYSITLLLLLGLLTGCNSLPVQGDKGRTGDLAVERNSPAKTFIQLAIEYMRQGNNAAALSNARKAVAIDRRSVNAQTILALVYQSIGENALAAKHFEKAINLDPKDPYALNAYGDLLCKQDKFDLALPLFDRAIDNPLYERPWVAMSNAGVCARAQGDTELAKAYFRKALTANKNYALALENMATLSYVSGSYLSARAYVERYRGVARPSAQILWVGIQSERRLDNSDQARSYELLLRAKYPDSKQVQMLEREN